MDDFGFIFSPCISRTIVFLICQLSHYVLQEGILNNLLQHCCFPLKIRGCCCWVIVSKIVQLYMVNISVAFQQFQCALVLKFQDGKEEE
jgi:hypothetical protein